MVAGHCSRPHGSSVDRGTDSHIDQRPERHVPLMLLALIIPFRVSACALLWLLSWRPLHCNMILTILCRCVRLLHNVMLAKIASLCLERAGRKAGLTPAGIPRWTPRPLPTHDGPKRIPRIIHRVDLQSNVNFHPNEANWRRLNPGWELRAWSEEACLELVQKEYPSYLDAYRALGRTVGQSDFFRCDCELGL